MVFYKNKKSQKVKKLKFGFNNELLDSKNKNGMVQSEWVIFLLFKADDWIIFPKL